MWEKILIKLLPLIISVVTPTLKDMICEFIDNFEEKAKESESPFDDFAATVLRELLCPKE